MIKTHERAINLASAVAVALVGFLFVAGVWHLGASLWYSIVPAAGLLIILWVIVHPSTQVEPTTSPALEFNPYDIQQFRSVLADVQNLDAMSPPLTLLLESKPHREFITELLSKVSFREYRMVMTRADVRLWASVYQTWEPQLRARLPWDKWKIVISERERPGAQGRFCSVFVGDLGGGARRAVVYFYGDPQRFETPSSAHSWIASEGSVIDVESSIETETETGEVVGAKELAESIDQNQGLEE